MPNDVADYTSSVVIQSGTVNISGTVTVSISGTPNVNIANVPAVTVNSGTINIGNTPSVSISGTPTVILGGGSASIGSVSAINSTVTVAGTVSISGTPTVTISGTVTVSISGVPTVNIGAGPANVQATGALGALNATVLVAAAGLNGVGFQLAAGTLVGTITPELSFDGGTTWIGTQFVNSADQTVAASIVFGSANGLTVRALLLVAGATNARVRVSAYTSGTANATITATSAQTTTVIISGTPLVSITGTPNVNIANTPSVTISSGTVSISGTPNINIQSQSVNLNVQQPQTALADLTFAANSTGTTQTTGSVPSGTHAVALLGDTAAGLTAATLKGHQSGRQYWPKNTVLAPGINGGTLHHSQLVMIPVDSVHDTTYDLKGTNNPNPNPLTVKVAAVLDTQSVEVTNTGINPIFVADATLDGYPPLSTTTQLVDGSGSLGAPTRQTYRAAVNFTPAASATDVFVIGGSSTGGNFVKITRITIIITATTAAEVLLSLLKRSTADTGGTATTATRVPLDSQDLASQADVVVQAYTANPTTGTLVGAIGQRRVAAVLAGTVEAPTEFLFGEMPSSQELTLRSTAEQVAINLNGASLAGGSMSVEVEWIEGTS